MNEGAFEVIVKHLMTMEEIADIVITAFEGGINYWCDRVRPVVWTGERRGIDHYRKPTDDEYERLMIDGCGAYANPAFWQAGHGYLVLDDEDNGDVLTAESIAEAIAKQPRERAARLIDPGQYDAEDADCVVQTAVFGEIVYG